MIIVSECSQKQLIEIIKKRNTMKKHFYIIAFLILVSGISSLQAQNSLIISLNDGTSSNNLLSSLNKVTFSAGNMTVSKKDASTSLYAISSIRNMNFGVYSGVQDISENQSALSVYPVPACDFINLKNAPEGQLRLMIFGLDGTILKNCVLNDSSQPIDISCLKCGLYLLRVNDKTIKFAKQ